MTPAPIAIGHVGQQQQHALLRVESFVRNGSTPCFEFALVLFKICPFLAYQSAYDFRFLAI
jgi:hypothetical protein